MRERWRFGVAAAWAVGGLGAGAAAQPCGPGWVPGHGVPGVEYGGQVTATAVWDPDGAGPRAPVLVVGGTFAAAGEVAAAFVAAWNPTTRRFERLGSEFNSTVRALAVTSDGGLYAGGLFTRTRSGGCNFVARWNGSAWEEVGGGMDSAVLALAVMPEGSLVAGGMFAVAGGVPALRAARWNGQAWAALGSGLNGEVRALAVMPNGSLAVGGTFGSAGGIGASRIARWDGSAWSRFGQIGISSGSSVDALAVTAAGRLVVGGNFSSADGRSTARIASWDGSSWSAMGSGMDLPVLALVPTTDGGVIAGGISRSRGRRRSRGPPAGTVRRGRRWVLAWEPRRGVWRGSPTGGWRWGGALWRRGEARRTDLRCGMRRAGPRRAGGSGGRSTRWPRCPTGRWWRAERAGS